MGCSAHTEETLNNLMAKAEEWIKDNTDQFSIFPMKAPTSCCTSTTSPLFALNTVYSTHKYLQYRTIGLPVVRNDLVAIRIFEPASKLCSLELMGQFFGTSHNRKAYHKIAHHCVGMKKTLEQKAAYFANLNYSFNFDIMFYDVTTLLL